MDQFGIRPLCPAPRGWIEFVREDAHGNRDGDAFGIEKPEFAPILPIETGARKRSVRQPGDRDVVEDDSLDEGKFIWYYAHRVGYDFFFSGSGSSSFRRFSA
jgi:hypothetical protein